MDILLFFGALLIVAVVWWGARELVRAFAFPEPIGTVLYVGVVIVVVLWLAYLLGVPMPSFPRRS